MPVPSSFLNELALQIILSVYVTLVFVSCFSTDNGPDTEIGLKIVFSDLVYDSGRANQWRTGFSNKVS